MYLKFGAIFLLIFAGLQQGAWGKANFDMIFTNCTCRSEDPEGMLSHLQCGLSKSVRRPSFSIELMFRQPVVRFQVNMRIVLPRNSGEDFTLFNLTGIDGCSLLSNKNQIVFIQLGRERMDRFSNVPKRCPWPKDVMYYVRGFRSDMQALPAFNFEADMNLWFEFISNGNKVIRGFIQSRVQRRRTHKKDGSDE
ncbi:GL11521 [Drosophila persimilis]|uniref:GL11521 n=2 Tax=Drosophila persimilis TaxID=7234 RepID=B4GBB9_DROPE|nr:GL11521 [Drosophila persimilis]